jgi:hypothetical protein
MRDYTKTLLPTERPAAHIVLSFSQLMFWLIATFFAAFLLFTVFVGSARADDKDWSTNAEANAGAEANVAVNTGAAAFGGGATINETKQAPGLGSLALGGGNPCAYAPATAQISVLGGGAGVGGMKIDEACALIVLGAASNDARAYKAAGLVIAGRNPAACAAMEQAGMVDCVTAEDRRLRRSSSAASTTVAAKDGGDGKCLLTGKTLAFRVSSGGDRDAELVACKAKYGLR